MKTAKEWFKTLEEPYRTQAIANTEEEYLNHEYEYLSDALLSSFTWVETPQKFYYWDELYEISNQINK